MRRGGGRGRAAGDTPFLVRDRAGAREHPYAGRVAALRAVGTWPIGWEDASHVLFAVIDESSFGTSRPDQAVIRWDVDHDTAERVPTDLVAVLAPAAR